MTREELDAASDDTLNELAAKVMGWVPIIWSPTTSIADAWDLVEKMMEQGFAYRIDGTPKHSSVPPVVKFINGLNPGARGGSVVLNIGSRTPRAITIAAIVAWQAKEGA